MNVGATVRRSRAANGPVSQSHRSYGVPARGAAFPAPLSGTVTPPVYYDPMNVATDLDITAGNFVGQTGRIYVDNWSPEYGPSLDAPEERNLTEQVDTTVETDHWRAMPGSAAGRFTEAAVVDGVRRVDARLTLAEPFATPIPGLAATFGVGAVLWRPREPSCRFGSLQAERMVVMGKGRRAWTEGLGGLPLSSVSAQGDQHLELLDVVQERMQAAEARLAAELAGCAERLVVADGRLRYGAPGSVVGYVKSQQAVYLEGLHLPLVGQLAAGERTPVFAIGGKHPRYSWYLSLAEVPFGSPWAGVARCEVMAENGLEAAVEAADAVAAWLPRLASEKHVDPRAPQNLVPIAALERELRKLMGDSRLTERLVREAVRDGRLIAAPEESEQYQEEQDWQTEPTEEEGL